MFVGFFNMDTHVLPIVFWRVVLPKDKNWSWEEKPRWKGKGYQSRYVGAFHVLQLLSVRFASQQNSCCVNEYTYDETCAKKLDWKFGPRLI